MFTELARTPQLNLYFFRKNVKIIQQHTLIEKMIYLVGLDILAHTCVPNFLFNELHMPLIGKII